MSVAGATPVPPHSDGGHTSTVAGAAGGDERTARTRALNDAFRRTLRGGRVLLTQGVAALPLDRQSALLGAVQAFGSFEPGNDPHGEHDFGVIEQEGECFFWKIDAYDCDLSHGSPDPSDPAVTVRVMTVMRADEY